MDTPNGFSITVPQPQTMPLHPLPSHQSVPASTQQPQKRKVYKIIAFVPGSTPKLANNSTQVTQPSKNLEMEQLGLCSRTNSVSLSQQPTLKPEYALNEPLINRDVNAKNLQIQPMKQLATASRFTEIHFENHSPEENVSANGNMISALTSSEDWQALEAGTGARENNLLSYRHAVKSQTRNSILTQHLQNIAELAASASSTDLQEMSIHLQKLEDDWRDQLYGRARNSHSHHKKQHHFMHPCCMHDDNEDDDDEECFNRQDSSPTSDATEACQASIPSSSSNGMCDGDDCDAVQEDDEGIEESLGRAKIKRAISGETDYDEEDSPQSSRKILGHRNIAPILLQLGQADLPATKSSFRRTPKKKKSFCLNLG